MPRYNVRLYLDVIEDHSDIQADNKDHAVDRAKERQRASDYQVVDQDVEVTRVEEN